jgi:hypothetical protein
VRGTDARRKRDYCIAIGKEKRIVEKDSKKDTTRKRKYLGNDREREERGREK